MEFSGACEGCGETPYVKLLTQVRGWLVLLRMLCMLLRSSGVPVLASGSPSAVA